MTLMKFLGILIALSIILFGIALIYFDLKKKTRKKVTLSDDLKNTDGIPVVPRHLRKLSEHSQDTAEETSPRLNIGQNHSATTKTATSIEINSPQAVNNEANLNEQNRQVNTVAGNEVNDADMPYPQYDIPPVAIQSNAGSEVADDGYNYVAEQINSLNTEESAFSNLAAAAQSLTPDSQSPTVATDLIEAETPTSASEQQFAEQVFQHEQALAGAAEEVAEQAFEPAMTQETLPDDAATNPQKYQMATASSSPTSATPNTTLGAMTLQERIAQSQFANESDVLNEHLEQAESRDQNSPLTNASDNINISILPANEFSYISGEKLLQLVDDFGFKFGSMNMFHRYQNKDGTGVLWFSMMGLTDEGIVPFDLNTLPTSMNIKGLVMFLPLPHPKVLQGFDSMMSIAGLLAREVNGYIVDEDGNEMTADYKKQMRNLLQATLVDD